MTREEIQRTANQDSNGAWFWVSNGRYLFNDTLEEAGMAFDPVIQDIARCEQNRKSIQKYIAHREQVGYSDEELAEMRAAFGEETTVVDIFTGKRIDF